MPAELELVRRSVMEKPAQNIQDTFLNTARKNRTIAVDDGRTPERAFLVGIDYRSRNAKKPSKKLTSGAQAARDSVTVEPRISNAPEFSAEESLAELRTLATSAGADVAGE